MAKNLSHYVNRMLNEPDSFEDIGTELALERGTRNFHLIATELRRQYEEALAAREARDIERVAEAGSRCCSDGGVADR